jgi:hypothetical protein
VRLGPLQHVLLVPWDGVLRNKKMRDGKHNAKRWQRMQHHQILPQVRVFETQKIFPP